MTSSSISIYEVSSKKDLKNFIHLPQKIHKNHKNWVHPIYMDEWLFFDSKKNLAFGHSNTTLLLAEREGEVVGRIMGIINHQYNAKTNCKDARFCFLEVYNDEEVASILIKSVEQWAVNQGMERIVGPLGFSDKDPQGLLIEGFNEPNVIATNCNFPYLVDFVSKAGYSKELDLVVYKIMIPKTIPDFYQKVYERVNGRNESLKLINLKSKKEIKKYVRPVLTLMNETFKDIYGFAELTVEEMDEFASRYIMVLDPRFLKIVENERQEVVAFVLAMPDISEGVKKSKGYMIPFGIFHVLRSQKTTKQLNLLLGAIKPEYQNKGIDTMLGVSLLTEAQKAGMSYLDSHLEMETNVKVRAEMERMGGTVYKRFRIFCKSLAN
jgi:ribosomal protein S18 acetylase RimI-like enzyme